MLPTTEETRLMPWVGAGSAPPLWARRGERGEEPRGCGPSGSSPVHVGWAFTLPRWPSGRIKKGRGGGGTRPRTASPFAGTARAAPAISIFGPKPRASAQSAKGKAGRVCGPARPSPLVRSRSPGSPARPASGGEDSFWRLERERSGEGENHAGVRPLAALPFAKERASPLLIYLSSSKTKGERQVRSIKAPHGLSPCPRKTPLKRSLRSWLLFQSRFADGSLRNSRSGRGCQPGKMKKSA